MNYAYLKAKMDSFFADDPAEILIKKFEELGYEFVSKYTYNPNKCFTPPLNEVLFVTEKSHWWGGNKKVLNLIKKSDLENFEVFCCNIASWYQRRLSV